MNLPVLILIAVSGFGIALAASRQAVRHASMLAYGTALPPFVIGITLLSIGTDVPEIANSIAASLAGHGDLNVGDSIGSVMTQITLVLGLLPFFSGQFEVGPSRVALVPLLTIVGLGIGLYLVADGWLARTDAVILIATWALATTISWKYAPPHSEPLMVVPLHGKTFHAAAVIGSLLLVGAGATAAVSALTSISALFGVPEYLISFFGASIGTSLPELMVDVTALRRGQRDLAFGDVTGSCLVDATLSLGAGPLLAPTAVTAHLAVRGALIAVTVVFLATAIIWLRQRHDRFSGAILLLLYAAAYFALL